MAAGGDQSGLGRRLESPAERQQGRVGRAADHCVRHLVDGLIVEPADAGVARDCLVVQYVAAVSDGVDRDGSNEALFDRKTRGAAHRWGAAAEQAAESVFGVKETPGVAGGVAGVVHCSARFQEVHLCGQLAA